MKKLDILTYPNKFLAQKSVPVKNIDGDLQETIDNMAKTMYEAKGVGLAAIQVGIDKSVLVYDIGQRDNKHELNFLINPEIISQEGTIISKDEGCLSVPDFKSDVQRSACIFVKGINKDGNPLEIEADGLLAIVLQHEIDHLQGKLFIERISSLKRGLYKRRVKKNLKKLQKE